MTFQFTEFHFWVTLILIGAAVGALQGTVAYLTLLERKISAWAQDRIGPNRVGSDFGVPFGLLQPIADGLKFLFKEQVIPGHVDKLFYLLAPAIAASTALLAFAVVPFGRTTPPPVLLDYRTPGMVEKSATPLSAEERAKLIETNIVFDKENVRNARPVWPRTETEMAYVLAADAAYAKANEKPPFEERLKEYNNTIQFVITPHVDIGIVFIFAIGSLAAYAIVLGGWSSNNKYSFLGALRSSAQLISYEIPLGMSVIGVLILAGSLNLETIIAQQIRDGWNVLYQPLAALLFVTSVFAETNRVPFDLPEAEQELVGGYHTEYSGMKFALFMLGEYIHMMTTSFLAVVVFFGGWGVPGITSPLTIFGTQLLPGLTTPEANTVGNMILKLVIFAIKMGLFICFYMIIRWTIPRFRFDQLMALAWKVMIPLALVNLVAVLFIQHFSQLGEYRIWLLLPLSLLILIGAGIVSLWMPRQPHKAKVIVRGHPVTGGNQVLVN